MYHCFVIPPLSIQVQCWNYVGANQGIYKVFQLTGFDMMTRLSLNGLNYFWPVIASPHIVMYVEVLHQFFYRYIEIDVTWIERVYLNFGKLLRSE